MGIDVIIDQLDELVPLGLSSVLLFPVLDGAEKEKVQLIIDTCYIYDVFHIIIIIRSLNTFIVSMNVQYSLINFRMTLGVWLWIEL